MCVITPEDSSLHGLRVCDLLIPGTTEWDVEMIEALFEERDVEEILRVPVGLAGADDSRIWHYDKFGCYTVKSAYRVCMEFVTPNLDLHVQGPWNQLWCLDVQPKMKNLVWRLARNVVPTRVALRRRRINVPSLCGICGLADESQAHLFLNCPFAIDCWQHTTLSHVVNPASVEIADFDAWLRDLLQSTIITEKSKIVAVLWGIWRERNRRVWTQEAFAVPTAMKLALDEHLMWKQAQNLAATPRPNRPQPACGKWHAPPSGVVKCNTDFALFAAEGSMGMGMVIRDSQGEVIKYKMWHGRGTWSPREGEAAALVSAMRWLASEGFSNAIFETDAEEVGHAANSTIPDDSDFGCLIAMSREMLAWYPGFSVQVVRRNRNMVAHVLARRSISFESPFIGTSPLIEMDDVLNSICFSSNH
ncbi:Putative ribonuclease H protein At1g65750 [Linum perenne]